jgi:hypothetical protein
MTPAIWTASTVSERTANLRGEAEQQRLAQLVRSGRRGGSARHVGSGRWRGWVEGIPAARIRLQRHAAWPGSECLRQAGGRS